MKVVICTELQNAAAFNLNMDDRTRKSDRADLAKNGFDVGRRQVEDDEVEARRQRVPLEQTLFLTSRNLIRIERAIPKVSLKREAGVASKFTH